MQTNQISQPLGSGYFTRQKSSLYPVTITSYVIGSICFIIIAIPYFLLSPAVSILFLVFAGLPWVSYYFYGAKKYLQVEDSSSEGKLKIFFGPMSEKCGGWGVKIPYCDIKEVTPFQANCNYPVGMRFMRGHLPVYPEHEQLDDTCCGNRTQTVFCIKASGGMCGGCCGGYCDGGNDMVELRMSRFNLTDCLFHEPGSCNCCYTGQKRGNDCCNFGGGYGMGCMCCPLPKKFDPLIVISTGRNRDAFLNFFVGRINPNAGNQYGTLVVGQQTANIVAIPQNVPNYYGEQDVSGHLQGNTQITEGNQENPTKYETEGN